MKKFINYNLDELKKILYENLEKELMKSFMKCVAYVVEKFDFFN